MYTIDETDFAHAVRIVAARLQQTGATEQSLRFLKNREDLVNALGYAYDAIRSARQQINSRLEQTAGDKAAPSLPKTGIFSQ